MEGIKNEIKMMGLPENNAFSVKDAKKIFRKKSFSMLPEKSLGSPNAHSQFEELNAAFVKLMNIKKEEGELCHVLEKKHPAGVSNCHHWSC